MPAYTVNPPVPPHPSNNFQRSWSDEHVPVNNHSRESIRPTPRSSSFSASRAPQSEWRNDPRPPPVPPLPPALMPGFYSPPLAHKSLDFTFAGASRHPPPVPQAWPGTSYTGPDSSQGHASPPSCPVTNPAPTRPPIDHRNNYSSPNSSFGSPQHALPGPTTSYVSNTPSLGDRRPSSYGLPQSFRNYEQASSPPPTVPPRPNTAHGEVRFEKLPPMPLQAIPLPPPVPPKTLTSPVTPSPLFPSLDDTQTSLSQDSIAPPSYDAQFVPKAREVSQPDVSEVNLPKFPGSGLSEVPETRQSAVPEAASPEAPTVGLPDVSKGRSFEVSEKGILSFPQGTETPLLDPDLKRAMTLSLADSQTKRPREKAQEEEEDDELARALAESLSFSTNLEHSASCSPVDSTSFTKVGLSVGPETSRMCPRGSNEANGTLRRPSVPDSNILSPEELEDHAAHEQIMQELEDEEVTRRLQEEEERKMAIELSEREKRAEERARLDAAFTRQLQEEEARTLEAERLERERQDEERARRDAELVRKEAAEAKARKLIREAQERKDAEMARNLAEANPAQRPRVSNGAGPVPAGPSPPQYTDVVSSAPVPRGHTRPTARPVQSSPQLYNGAPQQGRRVASAHASQPGRRPAEQAGSTRSATINGGTSGGTSGRRSDGNNGLRPESVPLQSRDPSPGSSNSGSSSRGNPGASPSRVNPGAGSSMAAPSAGPSRANPGAVPNPNQPRPTPSAGPSAAPSATSEDNDIGSDVLKGVSYGFKPPDARSVPAQSGALPVCPPFPEVISLFRAPSPPFHIMATSWRHLMRLLAQLETRIQANLEVIANSKEENLLRVVVQFVKLPYTANTWRTIIHLSLDQPVPRNVQDSWRFTNGDTTTLPYSYALAPPLPYFVNNPNSQFYVIPLSATSPFPIMPISLPNLALYLQSAMRDSRAKKVQNDPSNGMRRLARMVSACYPEETIVPDKEERKPARGVGNLFKRVVGRGGAREESQQNEEVYDIITPFRIDQYAAS